MLVSIDNVWIVQQAVLISSQAAYCTCTVAPLLHHRALCQLGSTAALCKPASWLEGIVTQEPVAALFGFA